MMSSPRARLLRALLLGSASTVLGSQSALAQAAGPSAAPAPAQIEEVVVTARRVQESKQTTPVAITAFSARALVAKGVENTADLQKLTPGVVLNGAGTVDNTTYTIRGQGKAVIGPGLPSVITYVDEVPLQSWGSSPPTFDLDNIQILKGPQGTSFGRNTTGGAVLVYTAKPNYVFGGYAQAQFGDYNDTEFQGAVNVPIVDGKFAVRVAADIERRDGYTKNIATGDAQDDKNSDAVRISALMQPTDNIKNVLVVDYIKNKTHAQGEIPFQYVGPDAAFPGLKAAIAAQAALGPRTVDTTNHPRNRDTFWGLSNTTTVDLGFMTAKNIFGYRNTNAYGGLDTSGLPLAPLPPFLGALAGLPGVYSDTLSVRQDEQFSDEVQFSGMALDKNLTWILGGFYLEDKPSGPDYLVLDDFRPVSPFFVLPPSLPSPISSLEDSLYSDQSQSIYLTTTYNLGQLSPVLQGFKLNGGYRYTWDKEGVCADSRQAVSFATGALLAAPYPSLSRCQVASTSFNGSVSSNAPTYTLGLDYKVNEDLFLYFTTRSGYRAGGVNSPAMASSLTAFQTYRPQKVTDYEVGLHDQWRFGDWRGRFDIDAFRDDYSALQFSATGLLAGDVVGGVTITPATQPSNTSLTLNAGTATFEGVDLDGTVSPFQGLTVSYGAAYLYPRYDKLSVPAVISPFFSAAHFTGSPLWSYQASAQYILPFHPAFGGDISISGDFYHIDQEYQGFALLPAYDLTDFSVAWSHIGGRPLDLTFFINNAFDKTYVQNVAISQPGLGAFSGNYGPPRMFGFRMRYAFGG